MRLSETGISTYRNASLAIRGAEASPAPASRALVPLAPAASARDTRTDYREAAFLAHLIAAKAKLPQTRERRRAEPDEAIAAYRAVARLTGRERR